MNLPHIKAGTDEAGRVWVAVEDTELADCIEDFLEEEHDLECLWFNVQKEPGLPEVTTFTFEKGLEKKILEALSLLDPAEVHRIFLINNEE